MNQIRSWGICPQIHGHSESELFGKEEFQEQLISFRQEIVERILLDINNYYRTEAVQASQPNQRQIRPSRALQSPYTQLNSADLENLELRITIGI
ncbi:hypothetical protein PIB30_059712 [Stylosanthes scabra]|uniref:Uncharacterized protein n=1 Tax=Stylosanthes scabra TaxID=79078 RepID=A0ABU6WIK2_9FABA|nr:hypothetical protein [Stylosanthes scabra]